MDKNIVALGLMSGTSMDGIDASIIRSDGDEYIDIIGNRIISAFSADKLVCLF